MKRNVVCFIALICFMIAATSNSYGQTQDSQLNITEIENDTTIYDVLIIDPGFETWLLTHRSPSLERSASYYKTEATSGVLKWNSYFTSSRYDSVIDNYIQFNSSEDYGEEVYSRIYWYFRYVDEVYGLDLIKH
ncbi:MAG: hypothetical protein IPH88_10190 [Bacteroidales bacterium]|nr:hypothetical protein [Bacteroidales bacterium]